MERFVLLFGTSANPPTGEGGHVGIVRWAAAKPEVDEVWVLPVYRHAYEAKRDMPSFQHRLKMAELAFGDIEKVRVSDVERKLGEAGGGEMRVYTVDVVRHLSKAHAGVSFGLLLGADTYEDLKAGRWRETETLLSMVRVVAVPRPGVLSPVTDGPPGLEDVSSTRCRNTTDRVYLSRALTPRVLRYIEENQLYAFGPQ